ncbi:sensor histidine kinase [Actinomadura hibisca]|uniref:sensor histidine kinase n=1 Tax=Actinomadura hibisca TaxID=68565 RepID=UPI000ACD9FED|nr:histidine kinase [Actinomadura hibisca]
MPSPRALVQRLPRLPPASADAVIALACCLHLVVQMAIDERLTWWIPILAAGNSLPLLWRRRYPFEVTLVCGIGTTALAFGDALGDLPAAQLVATYTFAALCTPVERAIAVAGTVVGVSTSVLIPKDEVLNLGVVGLAFAAAYTLGTAARARADRIAMLEERAKRLAEEQGAAATRERQRIAREMHDILAHAMSMVAIQAEAGPLVVRSDPDKAEEVFDAISVTAREALAQLRRALGVLREEDSGRRPPPGLAGVPGLVDGVRKAGFDVSLEESGRPVEVPQDLASAVYRIVQEGLTNTVKHARARNAVVRLEWGEDVLRVEVVDDGVGGAVEGGGHGLVGMRERVAAVGGELAAGPGAGGSGFRVVATLPLN